MNSKEIGGFFELELPAYGKHYHTDTIKLNTARNSFEYILKTIKINKVYLPYYNCPVMLEPINKTNSHHEFYEVNENLEIKKKIHLDPDEYILYINYFGIKNEYINILIQEYGSQLIVDNSQSFFTILPKDILSIYSPRKFFGVSDGGYLKGNFSAQLNLEHDQSLDRVSHLIGRLEVSGNQYYSEFKKNDDSLMMQDIKKMSKLTDLILTSLDYENIIKIRNDNFLFLHEKLSPINKLNIAIGSIQGPMIYPLLYDESIKKTLIKNKIYVATYWQELLKLNTLPEIEQNLVKNIIALPIDQRYNLTDMQKIVEIIKGAPNVQK